MLKERLKIWNREELGYVKEKKNEIVGKISKLDQLEEIEGLLEELVKRGKTLKGRWKQYYCRRKFCGNKRPPNLFGLRRGTRILIFFHEIANMRLNRNVILKFEMKDGRLVDLKSYSQEIVGFLGKHCSKDNEVRVCSTDLEYKGNIMW